MRKSMKRFLSVALSAILLVGALPVSASAVKSQTVELPTATVTEIENEDLTFALNFKADVPTEEQFVTYGDWYADFVLTVNKDVTFNANGEADGYLSGQYDAWSENWVNVPFEDVVLEAGESLKIMEYAASMTGQGGLKYTYGEICESVQDFDCGVFFDEEFLTANPDLKVTLELRMYNPADETESYVIGKTYTFPTVNVEFPTATVTELIDEELTFALNFKADPATDEQLAAYKDWYADFVLTTNKDVTFDANGGADGYLSGQYDSWSENWVDVPFEPTTLKAGESLKIMEYAAEMMGQPGLKVTYNDVYTSVKDFDCGVFFEEAYLEANPDLVVTLELRMYNPANEAESYVIGETYTYTLGDVKVKLPTATVTDLEKDDLTFALNFKADPATDEQLAAYKNWYADFVLTTNKDVTFNAAGGADGYLSGQYDSWSENWVNVPFEATTLKAGESLKIMAYAAEMMGQPGLQVTYNDVYTSVKDFDCGVFFEKAFLEANPDIEVTLELRMYNPADETESYVIGETYVFTLDNAVEDAVARNVETGVTYTDLTEGLMAAEAGQTVELLKNVKNSFTIVPEDVTFDLNGYTLESDYFSCYGNTVDYSEDNAGFLKVAKARILMQENNKQLPVKDGEGYRFFDMLKLNQALMSPEYYFQPFFETSAHELLAKGAAESGVTVNVEIEWTETQGVRTQNFEYTDDQVSTFVNSYNASTNKYGKMFTLNLAGAENLNGLTYSVVIVSETGVVINMNNL